MSKCLNFHAPYGCRHSGACCRAGWTIPFEPQEAQRVRALALRIGRFTSAGDGTVVAGQAADGACAFFEAETHLCAIHAADGQGALPLTCRMFPRVVLHDARGTFVSLSHFCPTAASLLFDAAHAAAPVAIVDAPSSLTDVGPLDGLDARDGWPPLLRRGVLMDLESFDTWECLAVELVTRDGISPRASVEALSTVTARITEWRPGVRLLLHVVRDAFATVAPEAAVLEAYETAVKRWLAARLFGTWIAYQGTGLQTIVRYLGACLDVFTIELARDRNPLEAIRRSDLLIVHEADSQQLARLFD